VSTCYRPTTTGSRHHVAVANASNAKFSAILCNDKVYQCGANWGILEIWLLSAQTGTHVDIHKTESTQCQLLHYHEEVWATASTENLVKFGGVFEKWARWADRHTDTLIAILCTPTRDEVMVKYLMSLTERIQPEDKTLTTISIWQTCSHVPHSVKSDHFGIKTSTNRIYPLLLLCYNFSSTF